MRTTPNRRVIRLATALGALAAAVVPIVADDVVSARPIERTPAVAWSPCFQDVAAEFGAALPPEIAPTYECAVVPVPLDYDDPAGGRVQISLVRLPALDEEPIGSMFVNPGGPGGSGVEFAVFGAPFLYSPDLRSNFDIVGFDPRGIGRSTSIKCFGNNQQFFDVFQAPIIAFPKTVSEAETWAAEEQVISDSCERRGNKVVGHMSTANVARDLDLLRAAVGDEQLTYAGYSYGTYLGQTYANMFPDRVRAMIIDGVLDPIEWSTGSPGTGDVPFSARLASDVGAQATLEEFFALCDANGPGECVMAPGSAARYEALAAALLANEPVPLQIPIGPDELAEIPFFYGDLIGMSLSAMYDSPGWWGFARDLAFIEGSVHAWAGTAPPTEGFSVGGDGSLGYTAKRGFPRYMSFEAFPAVACADSDNPDDLQSWIDAAGTVSFDDYFRQIWTWASSPCLSFPAADPDRYTGDWAADTAGPVLIASTLYDPATPVHGAYAARSLLSNSSLLLVEGWGHTTLGLSRCATAHSEHFLITQELPADGTVCGQDVDPFEPPPTGPPPGSPEAMRADARAEFFGG